MEDTVDKTFGIRYESGKFMIGDKVIKIQGDNIEIDGVHGYIWFLGVITERNPKDYSSEDYVRYKQLLYETNVLYRDYDPWSSYSRANKSKKWTTIFRPIWEYFQREGIASDDDEKYHRIMVGDGLYCTYLQKNGRCFNVHRDGNGLHLTLRPMLAGGSGNGLYIRVGSKVYDGKGLLPGPRSPFRNILILKWILWLQYTVNTLEL